METTVIDLTHAVLVGAGHERNCFRHPTDPRLVIKVQRTDYVSSRRQNLIDHFYLASLEQRGVPARHLVRQHGTVLTSQGEGLLVDCVTTADGEIAPTMEALLRNGSITTIQVRRMLDDVYAHFQFHGVVMVDIGFGNLACRQIHGTWDAVVIDGLGGRHYDLRLKLRARFPWLARLKLRKQWKKWAPKLRALEHP